MDLAHDLPHWLFALLTVGVFVCAALAGLVFARRWGRSSGLHALVDNSVIGWIFSAILVIYAIAIGLIAVASWGNSSQASAVASHEAAEIAALYRDLFGYPQPIRDQLKQALIRYTQFVIDEAWPAQRRGEVPSGGTAVLSDFERLIIGFQPTTDAERILHTEALHTFNALVEYRRQRLEATTYAIPGTLWAVVLVGAALSIIASYVFSLETFSVHAVMTSLLAAMIGLLVFFIATTDLPYRGPSGVGPAAYELVLHDLMGQRAAP